MRARKYPTLSDANPIRIFEPSKGGIGIRFRAASVILMLTKVFTNTAVILDMGIEDSLKNSTVVKAMSKFARTPAEDTKMSAFLLFGMLSRLTGTGFAHPKPTRKSMSVPIGSRCLSGLRLSLPAHLAVGSPIL